MLSWYGYLFLQTFLVLGSVLIGRNIFNAYTVLVFGILFGVMGGHTLRLHLDPINSITHLELDFLLISYSLTSFIGYWLGCLLVHPSAQMNFSKLSDKVYSNLLNVSIITLSILVSTLTYDLWTDGSIQYIYKTSVKAGSHAAYTLIIALIFLASCIAFAKRRFLLFLFMLLGLIIIGKKTPFLWLILFIIGWLWHRKSYPIVVAWLIGGLMLLLSVFSSTHTSNQRILGKVTAYFDYYENTAYVLDHEKFDSIPGIVATAEKLLIFIPRFVFEDKPVIYGRTRIHEIIWPEQLSMNYTPGLISEIIIPYSVGYGYMVLVVMINSFVFSIFFNLMARQGMLISQLTLSFMSPLIFLIVFVYEIFVRYRTKIKYDYYRR